ncbi:hypothetical protein ABMC89_10205 [Sulfitobacter sp. HNIBRBA3233]|uniref:hypothetical protein n=1 Tax=Sulfitobacter marinivivus TaxID=3158558 RepID=UPI0032DE3BD0
MTDWTASDTPRVLTGRGKAADSVPLPKPQPFGAPGLITDCVTPLAGHTVLGLLMKQMMRDCDDPDA